MTENSHFEGSKADTPDRDQDRTSHPPPSNPDEVQHASTRNVSGGEDDGQGPAGLVGYIDQCLNDSKISQKEILERALKRGQLNPIKLSAEDMERLLTRFHAEDQDMRILCDLAKQMGNIEGFNSEKSRFSELVWRVLKQHPDTGPVLAELETCSELAAVDLDHLFADFRARLKPEKKRLGKSGTRQCPMPDDIISEPVVGLKQAAGAVGLCGVLAGALSHYDVILSMAVTSSKLAVPRPSSEGVVMAAEWLEGKKVPRLLTEAMEYRIRNLGAQLDRSLAAAEVAERHRAEAAAGQQDALDKVTQLEKETSRLSRELESLAASAATQKTHLRDDIRQQRSQSLTLLKGDVRDRLKESLKALEREPPKARIARDYIGKVLDRIEEHIRWLES